MVVDGRHVKTKPLYIFGDDMFSLFLVFLLKWSASGVSLFIRRPLTQSQEEDGQDPSLARQFLRRLQLSSNIKNLPRINVASELPPFYFHSDSGLNRMLHPKSNLFVSLFLFESAGGKYRPQFFCLCLSLSLSCFVSSVLLVFLIFICLEFFRFARVLSDPPLPCCRHYHHHQSSNRFRSLFVLTLLVLCYSTSSMASGFANRLVVSGSGPSILARVLFIRSVVFEQSVGSYTNQHTMVRPYRPNPSAIAGGDKVGHTN